MGRRELFVAALSMATISGCISVKQIGKVNMLSTRNVDPNLKYKALSTYSGGTTLARSRALNVEEAVNDTVKKVPGGEFLMNVKLYSLDDGKYYAVEGDVWGAGDPSYRGFRAGDKVTFKNPAVFTTQKYLSGTIASLKSDVICLIAPDGEPSKLVEISYDDVTKAQVAPPVQ